MNFSVKVQNSNSYQQSLNFAYLHCHYSAFSNLHEEPIKKFCWQATLRAENRPFKKQKGVKPLPNDYNSLHKFLLK